VAAPALRGRHGCAAGHHGAVVRADFAAPPGVPAVLLHPRTLAALHLDRARPHGALVVLPAAAAGRIRTLGRSGTAHGGTAAR
jgi:hypothetical protein